MNRQEVLGLVVRYGTIVNSKFILSRIGINGWSLDFTTDSRGKVNYREFITDEVKEVRFNFDTMSAFITFKEGK